MTKLFDYGHIHGKYGSSGQIINPKINKDDMNKDLIKHLHNIGKAQLLVKQLLDKEIFETLNKHNDWWSCPVDEIASEKLEDVRCTLNGIQYELWEIQEALNAPEDEE